MLDKWIAALRSGNYKQGKGYLKKGDCHCCLGVLCEVAGIKPEFDPEKHWVASHYNGELFGLPPALKVGFMNLDFNQLMQWNDDGVPFTQIADKLADPSSEAYEVSSL